MENKVPSFSRNWKPSRGDIDYTRQALGAVSTWEGHLTQSPDAGQGGSKNGLLKKCHLGFLQPRWGRIRQVNRQDESACKGMWQLGDKSTALHPPQRKGDNIKRGELRDTQVPDHWRDFKRIASELLPRGKGEPMKECKQRNGDQIFLFGKVILAKAKKGMIGAESEGAKKKNKNIKNVQTRGAQTFGP